MKWTLEDKDKYIEQHLKDLTAETLRFLVADLQAIIAEQSAIISGKTFHDVQEATARECLTIVDSLSIAGDIEGGDDYQRGIQSTIEDISDIIRKKYNIKD